jgi:hypothetical protein
VCFASDSCVTVLSEEDSLEIPYGGIKVFAIPVRIIPTATSIPGQLGNRSQRTEENPAARRSRAEKKEEEFSVNLAKKIRRKKIPF